jgi:hypothetical protein
MSSNRTRNADEPHIGKYRLIKTIGKGNFAKVKLAKHELIGKEVNARNQTFIKVFVVLPNKMFSINY